MIRHCLSKQNYTVQAPDPTNERKPINKVKSVVSRLLLCSKEMKEERLAGKGDGMGKRDGDGKERGMGKEIGQKKEFLQERRLIREMRSERQRRKEVAVGNLHRRMKAAIDTYSGIRFYEILCRLRDPKFDVVHIFPQSEIERLADFMKDFQIKKDCLNESDDLEACMAECEEFEASMAEHWKNYLARISGVGALAVVSALAV